MKPTRGRIVDYALSEQDVNEINRRRTDGQSIAARIKDEKWPIGAQAHIGNKVNVGDVFPMMIVAVWSDTCVNGQVFLDGNDCFWALSRNHASDFGPATGGQWQWPKRE
jgi:hypothetical protein